MQPLSNGVPTGDSMSLDDPNYDPVTHLNAIFTHPSTLSQLPGVSRALRSHCDDLNQEIATTVAKQAASSQSSLTSIQQAKGELSTIFAQIASVRTQAEATEQSITEMTADIKRLDRTKKNLANSMTALKRLQMLTNAYDQLKAMKKVRQYHDAAMLVQAVQQLERHFRDYRSVEQIALLSKGVAETQRELLEQVCADWEENFGKGTAAEMRGERGRLLKEGCEVLDALGDEARSRLINWYCNTQLREYRQIFRNNDEAGSLDNISRRYSWLNRLLKMYDVEHATLFPGHWKINEHLANTFCESTREDYRNILQRQMRRTDGQTLDVNMLLSCLQETLDFEHSLERRFAPDTRASLDTITSSGDDRQRPFSQAISSAFEPYLSVWVEMQDKVLAGQINKYRQQPLRNPEEEFSPQQVLASSTELFHSYRLTMAQCAKLSTGSRLRDLSKTFAKYLDHYSRYVLLYFLMDRAGPQGPSIEDAVIILNTADYCYTTCGQLEERIKQRIDDEFRESVDLQSQADAFMGVASAAVRTLVRKVEVDLEPGWREMRNTPWSKMESVGDQSTYVSELIRRVREQSVEILKNLHKPQYARAFCDNLVDAITNTYIYNIAQCRPVSEVGAEQMLLDSYTLKEAFTKLPNVAHAAEEPRSPPPPPPAAYVKRVSTTMARIDPLLKTLQVRSDPPEGLVQAYLIHIRDASEANFKKLLELKGLTKRNEQGPLIELFNAHKAAPSHGDLIPSNPLLAALQLHESKGHGSTPSIGSTAKFDARDLGSALMSAAKEGVDRIGSGAVSPNLLPAGFPGSSSTAPATSGQATATTSDATNSTAGTGTSNLNDNLRNIGKFFRRDVGGSLGRFGRQTPTTDGG